MVDSPVDNPHRAGAVGADRPHHLGHLGMADMKHLGILVPTRGRPGNVKRLIEACQYTCTTNWQLIFGLDTDDPTANTVRQLAAEARAYVVTAPRMGLGPWTNYLWQEYHYDFTHFASLGDDHVPMTPGWDYDLIAATEKTGGGFAYCNNGHSNELPEMCVMSANVVDALGWVCEPSLNHYHVDTVWRDLGLAAGCLHHLPDVLIEHRHWAFEGGLAAHDETDYDEQLQGPHDQQAYVRWQEERQAADVEKVKTALQRGGEHGSGHHAAGRDRGNRDL